MQNEAIAYEQAVLPPTRATARQVEFDWLAWEARTAVGDRSQPEMVKLLGAARNAAAAGFPEFAADLYVAASRAAHILGATAPLPAKPSFWAVQREATAFRAGLQAMQKVVAARHEAQRRPAGHGGVETG